MVDDRQHWPTELRVRDGGRTFRITFDDGASYDLSAEYLRVKSPSAEVQGHSPADRKVVGGKRDVAIVAADPVGHYAVKLRFDDGHDTGLFTWRYLHELGATQATVWATYLADLEAKGLARG
ncbi:DUF971 domain-containing protein [Lichenihabitans sp. PAMC28606]|uniref:gamma-butyrobetaine hydroxylase-like domain-containing protein n=1 Tax=Lichenihabitans sp. PAMC28606 TaxID=2880932 RepID=UPI001D09A076|nr:DUF971 domain-containing protein [Lichenihabitans sp. PAMC28606]UDL95060.1 DUF971 domain-containing protein [Lichenihabitans sp. PAMC28606]